jgi:hypothetical protein
MNNEWLEIAWINFNKAIMHGQYMDGSTERKVEQTLTPDQVDKVQDMNQKHADEILKMLRGFLLA